MSKVIFITGVSSGLGKQTAEYLASKGNIVYGTSRRTIEHDPKVSLINMEATDQLSVQNAINSVLEKEGRIDVLINNAGMGFAGPIEDTSAEEVRLQMDSNFYSQFYTIQAVLPSMRKQKSGTIINVSSIGGLMGLPFQSLYSATKFAIEGMSDALRMELREFNINVVLINPGDFYTNFTSNRKTLVKAKPSSPYYQQYQKSLSIIEKDETGGLNPIVLAKKIHAIIGKKKPCHRYVISSAEQKLAVILKTILPGAWFTKILSSHYGIK